MMTLGEWGTVEREVVMFRERRDFSRCGVHGIVLIDGLPFALANMSPGGFAVTGGDVWFEADQEAFLQVGCGDYLFVLRRMVRSCYVDVVGNVCGFEFVGATVDETDMVLGLLMQPHSEQIMPLALAKANVGALERLAAAGWARCETGRWTARLWGGEKLNIDASFQALLPAKAGE